MTLDSGALRREAPRDGQAHRVRRRAQREPALHAGRGRGPRDDFDILLDPASAPYDLFAPPKEPVSLADYAMALHAATLDQGRRHAAARHRLVLRCAGSRADPAPHAQCRVPRAARQARREPSPDAELEPFAIGLYGCTEMLVDAFLALKRAGILRAASRRRRPAARSCMPASSSAPRPSIASCARCRPKSWPTSP